jgi:HAD superfamily hydrolase (TIGR01509 family)
MPLKAVLFDLWETLILDRPDRNHPRRLWRTEAVRGVLAKYDFEVDPEPVGNALDATTRALTALHDEGLDLDCDERAELFLTRLDLETQRAAPRNAADTLHEVIASMPLDMAPHLAPYAAETLAALRELGLDVGLVSNAGMTTAPNLRLMLGHYGIEELFDVLVFSDELKIAKPDARIFAAALTGIGHIAADCAFVGDNPHNDVYGATQVGMFAVQIGAKVREGITPPLRIDSLSELIPALTTAFEQR